MAYIFVRVKTTVAYTWPEGEKQTIESKFPQGLGTKTSFILPTNRNPFKSSRTGAQGHHQQELLLLVTYLCYIWKFNTSILLDIPNPKNFARRHPTQHTSCQCAAICARNRPPSLTRREKNRIKLWRNLSIQDVNPGSGLATMVKELMVFLLDDKINPFY